MREPVVIEDIEEMRRREGIDDVELRQAIRGLRAGDCVRLTALTGDRVPVGKPLLVRITSIRGTAFRGRIADGLVAVTEALVLGHLDGRYPDIDEILDVLVAFSSTGAALGRRDARGSARDGARPDPPPA